MAVLFTSLVPDLKRKVAEQDVGPSYQQACIDSWKDAGFDIVSLNCADEISRLRHLRNIGFALVDDRRPRITDFLREAVQSDAGFVGIINSDCLMVNASSSNASKIRAIANHTLVLAERHNVSAETIAATGRSCYGFDAFFFEAKLVSDLQIVDRFRIGDPWWDYWLPLAALEAGYQLKRTALLALLHLDHPLAWDQSLWRRNGLYMSQVFPNILQIDEFAENSEHEITRFANACFDQIRNVAKLSTFDNFNIRDVLISGLLDGATKAARQLEEIT